MNLLKPNEHNEDYHIREPDDENFLFQIEDKKYVYVGDKVVTFKTNAEIVKCSSDFGFNDNKHPFAYGEESIYFMLHQKNIPIEQYKNSTQED